MTTWDVDVPARTGTLGDFLVCFGPGAHVAPDTLLDPGLWPRLPGAADLVRTAAPTPALRIWWRGAVQTLSQARGGLGLALPPGGEGDSTNGTVLPRTLKDWQTTGQGVDPLALRGRFSVVTWDAGRGQLQAFTDAFKTCNVVWAQAAGTLWLASDLRLLVRSGAVAAQPSRQALYHYLNFSCIPSPLTALEGAFKLPAAHALLGQEGRVTVSPWWDARYPEDLPGSEAERCQGLRRQIADTVSAYRVRASQSWGAFLSGGTDSSSICSVLSRAAGAEHEPVKSFSIGFEEEGYDELDYARIASGAFGLEAYEHRVSENEAVDAVVRLASGFDEPFGNASAIPTHSCASLASRQGVVHLIAGDGGDEIFGGNERYRKDAIFEAFHRAPGAVRWLGNRVARALKSADSRWPNRVKNFVHRAGLRNPDRFYSDDAFASKHFGALLTPSFREGIHVDDALQVLRTLYARCAAPHELHRLMYLDLKIAIADNDVVKVVRAARLAGVDVSFPYLDRSLVDFTGRLPGTDKLRGSDKRYLFKKATHDLLPEAIRSKRKQGFGLPIAVWLRRDARYRELVHDIVLSSRAAQRDIFKPAFVRELIDHHEQNAWDHAAEVHQILMLELWHRQVVDAHG
jgi:asparagine synthase (glutamine-hydrolysing)